MAFVTKIKWVVLSVITLSVASIIIHLSLAKLWTVNIVPYRAIASFPADFSPGLGRQVGSHYICITCVCMVKSLDGAYLLELLQVVKNKKLWGSIKSLEALQPSSNARSNYTGNKFWLKFLSFLLGRHVTIKSGHFLACNIVAMA